MAAVAKGEEEMEAVVVVRHLIMAVAEIRAQDQARHQIALLAMVLSYLLVLHRWVSVGWEELGGR